jgi:DNA repair protein RadC
MVDAVRSSKDAFRWFADLAGEPQEVVRVLSLSAANEVLGTCEVFRGTLVDSPSRPREILRAVLLANAASFVVGHNHPSGKVFPSDSDARSTARLKWAAELIGLKLQDHLIVGGGEYFSFADSGLIRSRPSTRRPWRKPGSRRSGDRDPS